MLVHLPAVLCILSLAVHLWADIQQQDLLRSVSKAAASVMMVFYVIFNGGVFTGVPGAFTLLALVLSTIGDIALLSREDRSFLIGILAFLAAHVMYVIAFANIGVSLIGLALGLAGTGALGVAVGMRIAPLADDLAPAVWAYIAVITAMVAGAVGIVFADPTLRNLGLLISAVVFWLSDLTVAGDRFVQKHAAWRLVGLPLYYGAQLGFAACIAIGS